ncbi:MAG: hypothetical protein WDO71_17115 [Bacteroidota bacterium]
MSTVFLLQNYAAQFEERQTEKIYVGLVIGSPLRKKGVLISLSLKIP